MGAGDAHAGFLDEQLIPPKDASQSRHLREVEMRSERERKTEIWKSETRRISVAVDRHAPRGEDSLALFSSIFLSAEIVANSLLRDKEIARILRPRHRTPRRDKYKENKANFYEGDSANKDIFNTSVVNEVLFNDPSEGTTTE